MSATSIPVLYFDGVCNLCNGLVQFILRHDKEGRFLFVSLQSEVGKKAAQGVKTVKGVIPDSVILFYNGRYYTKSDAVFQTLKLLNGGWSLLYTGIVIPRFLRNAIYDFVSGNRYKWFGKRKECIIPPESLKSRFLVE